MQRRIQLAMAYIHSPLRLCKSCRIYFKKMRNGYQGIPSFKRQVGICYRNLRQGEPMIKGIKRFTGRRKLSLKGQISAAWLSQTLKPKYKGSRYRYSAGVLTLTMSLGIAAEPLDTKLPKVQADSYSAVMDVNIPSQPLATSLRQFATSAGLSVAFDSKLAEGKMAPAVSGRMPRKEALRRLLAGSGLNVDLSGTTAIIGKAVSDEVITTDVVNVRAKRFYEVGPLPGLGLTKEQIPGNVQSLSAQDIKESHALSLTDLMNSKMQSVTVNDYQGNPFQMDVQYRGFTAGPQIGTPQGLSAFIDGIRINEPFGDVVNWDMIPLNALASFDVFPGSNPIFGLGTLGGALSMKTKDGFNHSGVDAEILTGSFGRKQLQASGGWNNGTVGLFGAGNFFLEDGWRENSPSRVNQMFGKATYRGEKLDLNLSTLVAWNDLVGNGMIPTEMYKQDRNGVYTSPDTTDNRLVQFQLSGSYFVNDNFTITSQVYRRNSKRNTLGADVYTEFGRQRVLRNLRPGEQFTCLFQSTNQYKIPDYYVLEVQNGDIWSDPAALAFMSAPTMQDAIATLPPSTFNQDLSTSPEFLARTLDNYNRQKNFYQTAIFTPQIGAPQEIPNGDPTSWSGTDPYSYSFDATTFLSALKDTAMVGPILPLLNGSNSFYYWTPDTAAAGDLTPGDGAGVKHILIFLPPTNPDCQGDMGDNLEVPDPQTGVKLVDGAATVTGTGTVEGTPTAVLTDTRIDQVTDGASLQLNWNYDKHKFMVGASIDAPSAEYSSGQMLGLMDANRNAFLAPDQIRDQYAAASVEIHNNDFKGNQLTKSLYASETWSPIDTLHFTGAMRYNVTKGKNEIASRTHGTFVWDLAQLSTFPNYYDVCTNGVCPPQGYALPDAANLLNPPEKEKFSYYSLNPSLGVSWQAKDTLNIYGNWAQGTRVPSVIELGCAFDHTPVPIYGVNNVITGYMPKSLRENRFCSLPTTLSGDPYLPQIKAQSLDFGLRGKFNENAEWNIGLYRTNLQDDIYMIGFPGNRNFFDTIGNTRREGIEAGITGTFDKWKLRLNYAMTSATFEDSFWMPANDNSSAVEDFRGNMEYSRRIRVNPGDRMPGVPLHNLNATVNYQLTPAWQIGLTAVAHSFAYVRGNENNEHEQGAIYYESVQQQNGSYLPTPRKALNPGTTPGYLLLNFSTSYRLNSEWSLGLRVHNLLDKEYFTAGRLGRNPFSPSIYGAIGPDGYNHNSNDWLSTNFLAPGAPRAAWISLTYEFNPNK
jgi:outer membrane receptor protein involved in Fe transport